MFQHKMIPLARYAKFLPDTSVQSPKCFTTAKKKSSRCTVFLSYNVCSSAAAYGFARIFIRTRLEGFPSSYRSDAEIYIKIIPSFHRLMSLILIHHHIIKICICSFNYPKHKPRHFFYCSMACSKCTFGVRMYVSKNGL